MSSDRQREANRRNAKKSTGPKTPEGKTRSAQNARTHGLASRTFALDDNEEEIFRRLETEFRREYQPNGAREECVFETILQSTWRLLEARAMEEIIFTQRSVHGDRMSLFGHDIHGPAIDRCRRYLSHHQRALDKAEEKLRELQIYRLERRKLGIPESYPALLTPGECEEYEQVLDDPPILEPKNKPDSPNGSGGPGSANTERSQFPAESESDSGVEDDSEPLDPARDDPEAA